MSDLVAFLQARLDEREDTAKRAAFGWGSEWTVRRHEDDEEWSSVDADGMRDMVSSEDADVTRHIALHDPAAVLADIAAKRSLIRAAATIGEVMDGEWGCSHTAADILAGARIRAGEDPVPLPASCEGPKEMRRILGPIAALDATHPDYRQEWAP